MYDYYFITSNDLTKFLIELHSVADRIVRVLYFTKAVIFDPMIYLLKV